MNYLIVFFGAGLGGMLRHGVNVAAAHLLGHEFPFGTLAVNVVGSFVLGALAGYFAFQAGFSPHFRLFLATGILGGFTTFSAFTLDTVLLMERHAFWAAAGYVVGSVGVGLAALLLGLWIFRADSPLP